MAKYPEFGNAGEVSTSKNASVPPESILCTDELKRRLAQAIGVT